MKSIKSLLAVIMAVCMMMSLAIPTFATEETTAATTEAATEAVTEAVTEASTEEVTEAATEDATEAATEEVTEAATEEATEAGTEEATEAATEEETNGTDEDIEVPVEGEDEHDHEDEETTEVPEESLSTVQIILIVFEVIVSIALIGVVLMQSGKESGLSGALSGNSDSYMNKGGRANLDKKLASATKWIALVWILLTLILCLV